MVKWSRSVCFFGPKLPAVVAWSREAAGYVTKKTGIECKVEMAGSGNPFRIRWVWDVESMATHEQAVNKLMSDSKYMEILAKADTLFIPGTAVDEFWTNL